MILYLRILFCFLLLGNCVFAQLQSAKLILPIGHTASINYLAFSPDGKKLVTASEDKTAKIWDCTSGALIADLKGHSAGVSKAIFSPDGRIILTASDDNSIQIWDVKTGNRLTALNTKAALHSIQFSKDGGKIFSVSNNNSCKIWDAHTGVLIKDIELEAFEIEAPVFSKDEKYFLTISMYKSVKVHSAANGILLQELKEEDAVINSAEFSPDGRKIVTALSDGGAKVWDVQTGKVAEELKDNTAKLRSAQYDSEGARIVTVSEDSKVKIWNALTGQFITVLNGNTKYVKSAVFSANGKNLVTTADYYETTKIWDARSGTLIADLHDPGSANVLISLDRKMIVTGITGYGILNIWDIQTPSLVTTIKGYTSAIGCMAFSNDGKTIAIGSDDHAARLWDVRSGSLLAELKGYCNLVNKAIFSPNGKTILTASLEQSGSTYDAEKISNNHTAKIWDAQTGILLFSVGGKKNTRLFSASYSPDGEQVVTAGDDGTAKIWDVSTGNLLITIEGYGFDGFVAASFSRDGKAIITHCRDGQQRIWNAQNGALLTAMELVPEEAIQDTLSPDGKRLITIWDNDKMAVLDAATKKTLYTFFSAENDDYLVQTPEGYYMCTKNAAKLLHYVTQDLQVISFEQLDIQYNRPDKVMVQTGCKDPAMITAYKMAYYKRIQKLGIDTTVINNDQSVPVADLSNRNTISYEQTNDQLGLHINAYDSRHNLDRYNVWVNGVPVYGAKGKALRSKKTNRLDASIAVTLSEGKNIIETSVTNANGVESYHKPLFVHYARAVPVAEQVFFIGIGITQFSDSNYNLKWSAKDIRDLASALKAKYHDHIVIDTVFDNRVIIANIIELKKHLLQTSVNDKVIVAYSGHGLLSKDYDYYLSTYNMNFSAPEQNGLSYDVFENLLDSIPARKKLVLIDACNSGEVDKEELVKMSRQESKLVAVKGSQVFVTGNRKIGMKNSFEFMQNQFVNVSRNTGTTVIAAAAGTQFALEKNEFRNGVFTYSILEYMQRFVHCNVSELKQYVNSKVSELTNGMQVPVAREENIESDWEVW